MNYAEQLFERKMKECGRKVIISTKEQNIYEHIDFIVDGISYDVKAEKKKNRGDNETSQNIIWLEMKNVLGNKGWLCSNVDMIAFQYGENFNIFDRQELLIFIREFVGHGEVFRLPRYRQLYRRYGRKDLITYVYLKDIIHLLKEKI